MSDETKEHVIYQVSAAINGKVVGIAVLRPEDQEPHVFIGSSAEADADEVVSAYRELHAEESTRIHPQVSRVSVATPAVEVFTMLRRKVLRLREADQAVYTPGVDGAE